MGCNASQEAIIVSGENGSATAVGDEQQQTTDAGDVGGGAGEQQSSATSPNHHKQKLAMIESEQEVSTTTNNNNDNNSPGSKTVSMSSPPHELQATSHKRMPSIAKATDGQLDEVVHCEEADGDADEESKSEMVQSRAQSSTTKSVSSAASARSLQGNVAPATPPSASSSPSTIIVDSGAEQGNRNGESVDRGKDGTESATPNRLEICTDGASDLANNSGDAISAEAMPEDSTELGELKIWQK